MSEHRKQAYHPLAQETGSHSMDNTGTMLCYLTTHCLTFFINKNNDKHWSEANGSTCSFFNRKRRSDRQISNGGIEGNVDKADS